MINLISEEWRNIDGYEGYEVSNFGRIRSITRSILTSGGYVRILQGIIMKQDLSTNGKGYKRYNIKLWKDGKGRTVKVNIIVCTAFHGLRPTLKHQVAHKDGDSLNNYANNLRWATQKENEEDKLRHGKSNRGSRNGQAKLDEQDIIKIRQALSRGVAGRSIALSYGISEQLISNIKSRRVWGWLE